MKNTLSPNKLFYNFLAYMKPELSQAFRKKGENYETYLSLQKVGHKYIFNVKALTITHIFHRVIFLGNGYEKKIDVEVFLIRKTQKGFEIKKTTRIAA